MSGLGDHESFCHRMSNRYFHGNWDRLMIIMLHGISTQTVFSMTSISCYGYYVASDETSDADIIFLLLAKYSILSSKLSVR